MSEEATLQLVLEEASEDSQRSGSDESGSECKNNFSTNEESAGDDSDSEASNDTASYTSEVDGGQVAKGKRNNKLNIRKICFSDPPSIC